MSIAESQRVAKLEVSIVGMMMMIMCEDLR